MAAYVAESERLGLQRLNLEEHLQDYFEIMSAPAAMLWSYVLLYFLDEVLKTARLTLNRTQLAHSSIQQTKELMLRSMPTAAEPWNERWAIVLRPTSEEIEKGAGARLPRKPKMIGIVGTPRRGELAYKIHPSWWGQGYMSEAVEMFLKMWWGLNGSSGGDL